MVLLLAFPENCWYFFINLRKSITIVYDYFSPAFKAGGPIQSLANLVLQLNNEYEFNVITGAFDKGEKTVLRDVFPDKWNTIEPGIKVFYWVPSLYKLKRLIKEFKTKTNQTIYINGLYSLYFNILPLFLCKGNIILAPRGMLHHGALSQKSFKKKVYLALFKMFGWHKKIAFHATDENEKKFIEDAFGPGMKIQVAPNVPKNIGELPGIEKKKGFVSLISIALVSPMKNFELVLQALKKAKGEFEYHIYGPVINQEYWYRCFNLIKEMPENVKVYYHGELAPLKVKDALSKTHIFILPSVSENFGHAIFESFSAGKPVITSNNTPWKNLIDIKAGWNVNTNQKDLSELLSSIAEMDNGQYKLFCKGAKQLANEYFINANFTKAYKILFS